jgi:hypothetical protein
MKETSLLPKEATEEIEKEEQEIENSEQLVKEEASNKSTEEVKENLSKSLLKLTKKQFVSGPITWMTNNPGAQLLTGM